MADNTITVTGRAERTVPPDIAGWHLTIAVTDAEPRVAYERCAERARAIVERLKETAEVETRQISVQPHRSYETGEARPAGHRAATVVIARTPVDRAGEIADLAMAAGADEVVGPTLALRDPAETELDVLAGALADARRRAESLAVAAGGSLGPVVSITDDVVGGIELRSGPAFDESSMQVEPRDLTIGASVMVVFALAN